MKIKLIYELFPHVQLMYLNICLCMCADSLGQFNTMNLPRKSSGSNTFGFSPDMRYIDGTTVGDVQASAEILSHRCPLVSVIMTGKSVIECHQIC